MPRSESRTISRTVKWRLKSVCEKRTTGPGTTT